MLMLDDSIASSLLLQSIEKTKQSKVRSSQGSLTTSKKPSPNRSILKNNDKPQINTLSIQDPSKAVGVPSPDAQNKLKVSSRKDSAYKLGKVVSLDQQRRKTSGFALKQN